MTLASVIVRENNIISAYSENKYICFDIFTKRNEFGNTWKVKMDPNMVPMRVGGQRA